MSDNSPSLDMHCDAPPYSIVQACRIVALHNPEDVRWCRLSHLRERYARQPEFFKPQTWKAFWGTQELASSSCSCGQWLPKLEKITFTYLSGRTVNYCIGQCARCKTIFWEPA